MMAEGAAVCDFEGMVAVGALSSGLAYALRHSRNRTRLPYVRERTAAWHYVAAIELASVLNRFATQSQFRTRFTLVQDQTLSHGGLFRSEICLMLAALRAALTVQARMKACFVYPCFSMGINKTDALPPLIPPSKPLTSHLSPNFAGSRGAAPGAPLKRKGGMGRLTHETKKSLAPDSIVRDERFD